MADQAERSHVPVRTIVAVIGFGLATLVGIRLVIELQRIITWLLVAGFFAVVLSPAVDWLERHRVRRGLAAIVVFLVGIALVVGMLYAFIRPVVSEVQDFIRDFPTFVQDAREGRGPVGRLVQRYNVDEYIEENQERLRESLQTASAPALDVARSVASGLAALLTILVLAFLMLLQGPQLTAAVLALFRPPTAERVRAVAVDCARAISGYMAGNLLISVIAGLSTFAFLAVLGVPFSGVLGLWVAFADLIPLVGATLGAIPTIGVAFLHSTGAGVATLVFYVVYQQFENHVLQTTVMSRTVDLNPLAVLVSVLVGVELFGFLGALLAIPAAGMLQVIARNLWDERRGRFKERPTVGADEVPIDEAG